MRDARPCPVFYGLPMTRIFSFFVLFLFAVPAAADTLVGQATIVNGDTVRIGGKTVHLYGIDAPEMDQFCIDKRGNRFNCGQVSMRRLFLYIGADPLDCIVKSQMPKGAVSATCRVKSYFRHTENGATRGEKFDVALEMVLTGHAFATIGISDDYEDAEARARLARKGFWSGEFTRPSEWQAKRKAYRK